jgi:hypothetical protein
MVATLAGGTVALLLMPTGVWVGEGVVTLLDGAWGLFTATPAGWAVERLARALSFLVPDGLSPRAGGRLWLGPGHAAAVGAAIPGLIYALRAVREGRWSRARLQSNLAVAAATLRHREQPGAPGSTADAARQLLAQRGIAARGAATPTRAPAEPTFDEANAAAHALLTGIARQR